MTIQAALQDSGKRLDSLLHERLPEFSRSRLQTWIKDCRVLVNGKVVRASHLLREGESIEVEPAALPALRAKAEDLPLTVLYEDSDVIVVDKAAGMMVHAGAGRLDGTLVNALLHRFGKLSTVNGEFRPGIVHRLDRETSGVLIVARHDQAHQSLASQFQSRTVEKSYLTLVHGPMDRPEATISTPIARDPVRRIRMSTKLQLSNGRNAVTKYKLTEAFKQFSYLDVRILTGRTHQIRVHLASIGHPVVQDRLYGAPAQTPGLPVMGRFFLHAHRLKFNSPTDGSAIEVVSQLPPELTEFLERLREHEGAVGPRKSDRPDRIE